MPGKRLIDPSLTNTTYPEAVTNNAELLTDFPSPNTPVWARPIPIKFLGNSWWQGSYTGLPGSYVDYIEDDHAYARLSTDGGETWLVFDMGVCSGESLDTHPPVTIGSPDGGLIISGPDTQVLTLPCATTSSPGAFCTDDKIKLDSLYVYELENIGGANEIYDESPTISGDTTTYSLRTLAAGTGVTINQVGNTLEFSTIPVSGTYSQGRDISTDGVHVFDSNNNPYIDFRGLESVSDVLTITLDDTDKDIEFDIVESNIDHNVLENHVTNEHINHANVSILTEEGVKGGGDLTSTRTLSLDVIGLSDIAYDANDYIVVYDLDTSTHYKLPLGLIPTGDSEDLYVYAGTGLSQSNSGLLDSSTTLNLDINSLPSGTYTDGEDYLVFYDISTLTHAKTTINALSGVTTISAGDGMNFTDITTSGNIDMGTPSSINQTSTNSLTATSHTHALVIDELTYIGDVDETPTSGEYLKWNGTNWVTDDPAIGATLPGTPAYSIQFNDSNTFGGSAGLLYKEATDRIYISDVNTNTSGIVFGTDETSDPQLYREEDGLATRIILSNEAGSSDSTDLLSSRISLGTSNGSADSFLYINDPNNVNYTNAVEIQGLGIELFKIESSGGIYAPSLSSATEDNVLYYDTSTGLITYGVSTNSGGSSQTLIADALSGLMVNEGNTSSASTIELDQNDNKLTEATAVISDYIGFWDVSSGLQSKTQIGDIPGLGLQVTTSTGSISDNLLLGETLNIESDSNAYLEYNSSTNTLTIGAGEDTISTVDLYTNDTLQEEDIDVLNITSDNIGIAYTSPGKVTLSYEGSSPKYTHFPDSYIAYNNFLFEYDITEGTSKKLYNAPVGSWNTNTSFGEDGYIWTTNGTTLYRYDIANDTTTSVRAGDADIMYLLNASDGIYAIDREASYHVDKSTMTATYYGNPRGFTYAKGLIEVRDAVYLTKYLLTYRDDNDTFYYKEIKSTYSGSDSDDWTKSIEYLPNPPGSYSKLVATGYSSFALFDSDNVSVCWNNIGTIIGQTGTGSADNRYYTFTVPSAHSIQYSGACGDAIKVKDYSEAVAGVTAPTSYIAASTISDGSCAAPYGSYSANLDKGIYVAIDQAPFTGNFQYEQAVNHEVFDIHREIKDTTGCYVMAGGKDGYVFFHNYDEDPKQFMSRKTKELDESQLHPEEVNADVTFVYFNETYTGGGLDPKDIEVTTGIDLHVNNTLVQEQIPKVDIIEGTGITATYSGDAGVTISATGVDNRIEDIAFDFNDVTGDAQTYILDLEASYDYDIIEAVVQSDASVAFNIDIAGTSTITDTATTTISTHLSGDSVTTGDQVTLDLATSSATLIRGKLRIRRT